MTVSAKVKQTLASLKGVQATLNLYATQTNNDEIKTKFMEAVSATNDIIKDLEDRVKVLEFQEPQYKGY
ncbi:MAG: DUF1657 domain-containing protein [Bacillota bacterium]